MNPRKNSPTYLLLKDYFRRYRIIFGLFAVAQIFTCTVLLTFTPDSLLFTTHSEGGLLNDMASRLQSFFVYLAYMFALAVSSFFYYLITFFISLVLVDLAFKWRRAALTLPVSNNRFATSLWVEIVVIPTLLFTVAAVITLSCDLSGPSSMLGLTLLRAGVSAPGLAPSLLTILTRTFLGSICITGVACLVFEVSSVLGRRFIKRGNSVISFLRWFPGTAAIISAAELYLAGMASVLETWDTFTVFELALIALGLCSVAASFFFRGLLPDSWEGFRFLETMKKRAKPVTVPAAKARRKHPFLSSYARLTGFIVLASLACYPATWIYIQFFDWLDPTFRMLDVIELGESLILPAFFFVPLVLSITATPPLRACRCLPLSSPQLLQHFLAYPVTVFLSIIVSTSPLIYLASSVHAPQAIAIQFVAFGFAVFTLGLLSFASNFALLIGILVPIATIPFALLIQGEAPFASLIAATYHSVQDLAILACVLFAVGLTLWFVGITRSSLAYNAMTRRDLGKIVF